MTRHRLANRRGSETFYFECAGLRYTATISRFPDGRLGEIFIDNGKARISGRRRRQGQRDHLQLSAAARRPPANNPQCTLTRRPGSRELTARRRHRHDYQQQLNRPTAGNKGDCVSMIKINLETVTKIFDRIVDALKRCAQFQNASRDQIDLLLADCRNDAEQEIGGIVDGSVNVEDLIDDIIEALS
jgi:hypothetical protein